MAQGNWSRLGELGRRFGWQDFPTEVVIDGVTLPKSGLQYIEKHDHERFLCNFGVRAPRDKVRQETNPLFLEGDREANWFRVQPYLIALLLSRGTPRLWQGQEFCEKYFLPDDGLGRVRLERPVRWDYFYDAIGKRSVRLARDLLRLRRSATHLRSGNYFFFDHHDRYLTKGLILFARYQGAAYTLVAINLSGQEQWVPFWFPIAGDYREELHGTQEPEPGLHLRNVQAWQERWLQIPANYGRVWTAAGRV